MQLSHLFRNSEFFIPFKAGDTVFKEGDPGDQMYVVLEGEVDIIVHNNLVETVSVDNFLGEMALIDERPRSATAVAKTDCKLAPINQNRFKFLVQQTPHFALHLILNLRRLTFQRRRLESEMSALLEETRAQIRSHDDDRVLEVDLVAQTVRQLTIFEDLMQGMAERLRHRA